MALTKSDRQRIVEDFAARHSGVYDPKLFVEEVRTAGAAHPAFGWFEWDRDEAALQHQLHQAREFVRGLVVNFTVQEVGQGPISVREVTAPLMLSQASDRDQGGSYRKFNPNDPDHIAELQRQACVALCSWLHRFDGALPAAGVKPAEVQAIIDRLAA